MSCYAAWRATRHHLRVGSEPESRRLHHAHAPLRIATKVNTSLYYIDCCITGPRTGSNQVDHASIPYPLPTTASLDAFSVLCNSRSDSATRTHCPINDMHHHECWEYDQRSSQLLLSNILSHLGKRAFAFCERTSAHLIRHFS